MSFNIPIENDTLVQLSGATVVLPGLITASGDTGILRQSSNRDLFITGNVFGNVSLDGFNDSPSLDAFSRLRVSNPTTLFESKQIFNDQELFWSFSFTNATSSYLQIQASTILTVSGTSGSNAIKQSRQRLNYQPGKSLMIMQTFVMGTGVSNLSRKVGYFDDENGLFFQQISSSLTFVLRSNYTGTPTDTAIPQSSWNIDRLDGSGISTNPSGITLDITKAQILFLDMEWLGVGRARVGFVFNGQIVYAHQFNLANTLSGVYMSTPNLPIRYQVESISGSIGGSLTAICSTVISEGGVQFLGALRSINRGSSKLLSAPANSWVPVLSLRLNSNYKGSSILPTDFTIVPNSSDTFLWGLFINPIVSGSDAVSWQSIPNSAVEYDINRTSANTLSGGTLQKSGYITGQGGAINFASVTDLLSSQQLGFDVAGNSDQLVLAIQHLGNGTMDYYGSISWREIY